jgi:hypothetical protein
MSTPSFPVVKGQTASDTGGLVTLALTITADADNPVVGDLHLLNKQIHFWDGVEARYQKTLCLLKFVKGEWFLNTEEGVPYFQHVWQKNPNTGVIRSIFRKALLASPGAREVTKLLLTQDRAERTLSIEFEVVFEDGLILRSQDFPPFVIALGEA